MFAFGAENKGAESFKVFSIYGAEGEGSGRALTLEYNGYVCYVLQVYGTTDASVNKMIVLK